MDFYQKVRSCPQSLSISNTVITGHSKAIHYSLGRTKKAIISESELSLYIPFSGLPLENSLLSLLTYSHKFHML